MVTGKRLLLLACLAVSGCSLRYGGPAISDRVWVLDQRYDSMRSNADYIPGPCPQTDGDAANFAPTKIPLCVDAMLQVIDVKWTHFQSQLLSSTSGGNFATDVGLLGLNTAGTFVSGGATQVLHAASAAITGIHSSVNQDLLYSNTIIAILAQMQADRKLARQNIQDRLNPDKHKPYTDIYQAANDLFNYASAGSWTSALLSIQASAAKSAGNSSVNPTVTAPTPPTQANGK